MNKKLKYFFYKNMSLLTFGRLRKYFLSKKQKYQSLSPNHIQVVGVNNIYDTKKIVANNIYLTIDGNNNEVILNFDKIKGLEGRPHILRIYIRGNDNKIQIGEDLTIIDELNISFAYCRDKINHGKVIIGKENSFVKTEISLLEDYSSFEMGNDCMFSRNITVNLSDTHSVLDLNGKLLNYGTKLVIGNHVWCGESVHILKNARICDDSIIGAYSVVAKKFTQSNIAIAGNPAKVIKTDINWSRKSPQEYLDSEEK